MTVKNTYDGILEENVPLNEVGDKVEYYIGSRSVNVKEVRVTKSFSEGECDIKVIYGQ